MKPERLEDRKTYTVREINLVRERKRRTKGRVVGDEEVGQLGISWSSREVFREGTGGFDCKGRYVGSHGV